MSSANPFESPLHKTDLPNNKPESPRWISFFLKSFLVTVALLFAAALLLPTKRGAREPARRVGCINNIRQIQLAVLNYETALGRLPPAYTIDEDGNRLHSWRSLILPYIEESEVYESIDFTKPWDHPTNAKAREASIRPYICPSAQHGECMTTYMALVGPNHVMSESAGRKFEEFPDPGQWAAIMEVPSEKAIHWMSPRDADAEFLKQLSADTEFNHDGFFIVAFLDGRTLSITTEAIDTFRESLPKIPTEVLESL